MSTRAPEAVPASPSWPAFAVALPIILAAVLCAFRLPASIAWDFHQFYVAGTVDAAHLYNKQAQQQLDHEVWQSHLKPFREFSFAPFLKPAYYRALLVPLARLPFWKAYGVWVTLQLLCFIAAISVLARRFGYHASWYLPLCLCPYLINSLLWGQDTSLVLLLLTLTFELLLRGRDRWAGLTLALSLIKYNVVLLIPALLVAKRKWKAAAAFSVAAAAEVVLSCWIIPGRTGLGDYLSLLRTDAGNFWDRQMPSVHGIVVFLGWPEWLALGLTLIGSALVLLFLRRMDLEKAFPLAVAASVLLAWHAMWYDLTLFLIPLVALRALRTGWRPLVTVLFLSPLSYRVSHGYALLVLLLMAVGLVAAARSLALSRPLVSPEYNDPACDAY